MMYDLDGILPPDLVTEVAPGTNLLVSGPAMSGKRQLMLQILARGGQVGEGGVIVTANDPAPDVIEEYRSLAGDDGYVRLVDCVSSQSGGVTGSEVVRTVSSPGDLTGIGIEFSEIARQSEADGVERLRIGFDSISPLLMYVDLQRLFRFLHVFTSQIQSNDWLGLFSIDPESHEEQAVNTISQLFDGLIEIRLREAGGREARVRGITDTPTEWVTLE